MPSPRDTRRSHGLTTIWTFKLPTCAAMLNELIRSMPDVQGSRYRKFEPSGEIWGGRALSPWTMALSPSSTFTQC